MHVPWTFHSIHRRRLLSRLAALGTVGTGVLLATLVSLPPARPGPTRSTSICTERPSTPEEVAQIQTRLEATRKLAGVWWLADADRTQTQRFYYFHGDGKGLFRYGEPGLTNTHSFDYRVDGDQLMLRFRKSGDHHVVRFAMQAHDDGTTTLQLYDDPRGRGGPTTWVRESERTVGPHATADDFGRMWIDLTNYATGGQGFALYQLRAPGIDGRGTGWFHRGDFDDWSTEALTYRRTGDTLELTFEVTGQTFSTPYAIEGTGKDRALRLDADPRDYGLHHRYADGGASFGALNIVAGLADAQPWSTD